MTSRELMDGLCGTLLADDRILSAAERDLLTTLLQRTGSRVNGNDAARDAITRSMGELIAERALGVLGESITRQLLQQPWSSSTSLPTDALSIHAGTPPTTPPTPATPRTPGGNPPSNIRVGTPPIPAPGTPRTPGGNPPSNIRAGTPPTTPPPTPGVPRTPGGNPPSNFRIATTTTDAGLVAQSKAGNVAILDAPPLPCVVLDEFLASAELDALMRYTLEKE